jgi:hypothetical protein
MASGKEWFESVAEAQRRARRRLPKSVYGALVAGSERGLERAERARKAGAVGLIMTLDWTFATRRDWGSPPIPERLDLKAVIRFAPETDSSPGTWPRGCAAASCPT